MLQAYLKVEQPLLREPEVELVLGMRLTLPWPQQNGSTPPPHAQALVVCPLAFWHLAGVEGRTMIFANSKRGIDAIRDSLWGAADILDRLLHAPTRCDYQPLQVVDATVEHFRKLLADREGCPEFVRVRPQRTLG